MGAGPTPFPAHPVNGESGPPTRGIDARALEDPPDCRGHELMAKADQLAVDAPVAPRRVVAGHLQHQFAYGRWDLDLPLQHGDLMAQDQDLLVLRAFRSREQGQPAEHPEDR